MIHVALPARPSPKRPPVRDYLFLATTHPDVAARAKVRDVILHVAKIEGALFAEIVSQRRTKRIAEARQIAMWVSVTICGRTLPEIGRVIGRDHTTILHGARKIAKALESGEPLGKRAEKCRAAVLWNLSKAPTDIAGVEISDAPFAPSPEPCVNMLESERAGKTFAASSQPLSKPLNRERA